MRNDEELAFGMATVAATAASSAGASGAMSIPCSRPSSGMGEHGVVNFQSAARDHVGTDQEEWAADHHAEWKPE